MPPRERVMFTGSSASHSKVSAGLSRNRVSSVHQSKTRPHTGVETLLDLQRTHGNVFVQRLVQRKLMVGRARVFAAGQYRPKATAGIRLLAHELTQVAQQSKHASYTTIQRQEPEETQTALQKLDADLASGWTLDRTIQTDLKALSQKE